MKKITDQARYDFGLKAKRQLRAFRSGIEGADFLVRQMIEDFGYRIGATNREFEKTCTLFSFFPVVCEELAKLPNVKQVTRYELPEFANVNADGMTQTARPLSALVQEDSEAKENIWPDDCDLIVSILGLPTGHDFPKLLKQIFSSLRSDGLLLLSLPATGTLKELQSCLTEAELDLYGGAAQRINPFLNTIKAGNYLQEAGFKLPVIDREELIIRYVDDLYALVRDLRAMGATSAYRMVTKAPFSKDLFSRANEIYLERFSDSDGRIRASFNYLNLTAWTPHESQQKPLKPGSAKTSLAQGLKAAKK